jgi:hypothetical protein
MDTLEWNLEELRAATHLNAEDVLAYFTDGRRVSFMLERRSSRGSRTGSLRLALFDSGGTEVSF